MGCSYFFVPIVFAGNFYGAFFGVALRGIGMGAQESIMRAAIAGMATPDMSGTAYGVFDARFGAYWFLGGAVIGLLYDKSIFVAMGVSMFLQVSSLPLLYLIAQKPIRENHA